MFPLGALGEVEKAGAQIQNQVGDQEVEFALLQQVLTMFLSDEASEVADMGVLFLDVVRECEWNPVAQ